ncbi:hypothetical protein IV203_010304 [Nitzschia inconspicua]|uniref:Uncharacterized protein n=1 Tax=Nitzschia inconspicua TaxID=303405 RepID=A0A9K3KVT7_9STRA|nr:hypothetical protein IV203_010304 [Nitzschia inconspicua]
MDSKGSDEKDDDYDEEDDDRSSDSSEGKEGGDALVSPPAKSKVVSYQNSRNDRTINSRNDKTGESKILSLKGMSPESPSKNKA